MINVIKLMFYMICVVIGLIGFLLIAMSGRDLLWGLGSTFAGIFGIILGVVFVVGSAALYDSLWKF